MYISDVRGGGTEEVVGSQETGYLVSSEADPAVDYSQALRAIGQVLEPSKPRSFDIVCYGDSYLVRYLSEKKKNNLFTLLEKWKEHNLAAAAPSKPFMNVEALYSLQDLQIIDDQGKAKRRDSRGMPDPFSLSTLLRAIGDFVNHKGRLIFASSRECRFVVLYETPQGLRQVDEYETSSFYDIWVSMYLRRSQRVSTGLRP